MTDFGPNLFAGTAAYYAKFRPGYPAEMFNDIVSQFGLDGQGGLLDVGCGTGELAIPLAGYFENVTAIDPDLQMLDQAKLKAQKAQINNIEWLKASSKELESLKRRFKLITLGQSFHWMDEKTVIKQLYNLLKERGSLFIVGGGGISVINSKDRDLQPKDRVIKRLVIKYLGRDRRAGGTIYKSKDLSWEQDIFPYSNFSNFEKRIYQTKVVRNLEQELGNLYSMSWARREFFGTQISPFESEFRRELSTLSQSGSFANLVSFEAFFLYK